MATYYKDYWIEISNNGLKFNNFMWDVFNRKFWASF